MNLELIKRFRTILNVPSSTHNFDADKFDKYAKDTAQVYIAQYGDWRQMSATVHKVLYHGGNVMRHHIFPLGELSEEAQEAKNKEYKKYRLNNTRKNSRLNQNTDLFTMLLLSSDPLISTYRNISNKKHCEDNHDLLEMFESSEKSIKSDIVPL